MAVQPIGSAGMHPLLARRREPRDAQRWRSRSEHPPAMRYTLSRLYRSCSVEELFGARVRRLFSKR